MSCRSSPPSCEWLLLSLQIATRMKKRQTMRLAQTGTSQLCTLIARRMLGRLLLECIRHRGLARGARRHQNRAPSWATVFEGGVGPRPSQSPCRLSRHRSCGWTGNVRFALRPIFISATISGNAVSLASPRSGYHHAIVLGDLAGAFVAMLLDAMLLPAVASSERLLR